MNREDIIRFGEQADEIADRKIKMRGEYHPERLWFWRDLRDEAFAALVAAYEREQCARVCESSIIDQYINLWNDACQSCADDIRARSNV